MKFFKVVVLLALVSLAAAKQHHIRSPLRDRKLQKDKKGFRAVRELTTRDMRQLALQAQDPRHRELFFSSFVDFYCKGGSGFMAIIAAILSLLGLGMLVPGCGGGCGGGGNSGSRAGRALRAIQNDIDFIKNKANYENMTEGELKELVDRVLRGLEFNVPGNHELHGRNLFLELIGLVNCNATPPSPPQNQAPVANPDTVNAQQGDPLITIAVLDNDSDPDDDALTVISTTTPSQGGTVAIIDSGDLKKTKKITYAPPSSTFCGQVTFDYTMSDGSADATAKVTIDIQCSPPQNQAPVANPDTVNAQQGDPLITIAVLDNDSDPDDDALTVISTTTPSQGGTVAIIDSGDLKKTKKITYAPPSSTFCGQVTFDYTMSDGSADATAKVTIDIKCIYTVDAVNDNRETTKNVPIDILVLENDTISPAGVLTVNPTKITTPNNGGTVLLDPTKTSIRYTPKTDYCGSDTFNYFAVAPGGEEDEATVTVTIYCVDAVDDRVEIYPGATVTINVLDNDKSVPAGPTLTVAEITKQPTHGTVTIVNNQVEYTHLCNLSQVEQDKCGQPCTNPCGPQHCGTQDTFEYRATSSKGASDTATVTVVIKCGVDAQDDSMSTNKNKDVDIYVLWNDHTIPSGGTLTVSRITTPPDSLKGAAEIKTSSYFGTSYIKFTPATNFVGKATFEYEAKATPTYQEATDTAWVTVTVSGTFPCAEGDKSCP